MRTVRILAVWQYSRRSWIAPLERLIDEHGFDIVYLAHRTVDEEPREVAIPPARERLYWRDFRSARHLLQHARAQAVLLMGTTGAWTSSLVLAAHRAGVPTIHLQHGLDVPQLNSADGPPTARDGRRPHRVTALAHRVVGAGPAAAFLTRTLATQPLTLGRPRPDLHLVAGPIGAERLRNSRRSAGGRVMAVGLPEHDALFRDVTPQPGADRMLLVDTPHTGGPHNPIVIAPAAKVAWIRDLAAGLGEHGWSLTVKLHPASYADAWPGALAGIEVIRDTDLAALLSRVDAVIGFDSSLLVPALHHRPVVLAEAEGASSWFSSEARASGIPVVDGYAGLDATTVLKAVAADDVALRRSFVTRLTAATDGRSLERVAGAIRDAIGSTAQRPSQP